jgi:mannose/fructose/N-acetylgalactosamine-specific phosphotransferase system component IIC
MWQFLGVFVFASLLVFAAKLAILLLVIAGLIFRTKETIGLLLLGGTITAFTAHPMIGIGIAGTLLAISLFFKYKEKRNVDQGAIKSLPRPDD